MNLGHPPPKPTGKSSLEVSNAWMNDYVRTLRIIDSPDIKPSYTRDGCMLWYVGGGGGSSGIFGRYKITAIGDTKLTCKEVLNFAGDLSTEATEIALPEFLAKGFLTTRGGLTYSYTSDYSTGLQQRTLTYASGAVMSEEIRPNYAVDDIIYAAKAIYGTKLENVEFIDVNVDGRNWLPRALETEICESGTSKLSLVYRSSTYE